ncbi:major facilitator superfamily domain-containing protein, partial [Aureobasidium melanogenum]|uniref:Molybdate-anion transporter n=1 Tax=Aureobasidium melanogenum (strain CBS 110374) TaxID=1043003 RepID=A0A074VTC1_AURM1
MGFYETNLAVLAAVSTYLLYRQHQSEKENSAAEAESGMKSVLGQDAIKRFKRSFFPAYALVCAADWLQGPHIYALYKYHKHLPETTVAALYASGFVAGALSASFVGQLADKYGRRNACLLYCIIYTMGCFTMLSDDLLVLFAGRACGGISTTLLYSVFETWMIAEYHDQALDAYGLSLGSMFGKMTTLSSVVAIVSGVVGDFLVKSLDSKTSPFMASVTCLVLAFIFISKRWVQNENYGDSASSKDKNGESIDLSSILFDPKIISVGLASCFFEGSMYMFVFFWSAALSTVHAAVGFTDPLPFGVVFSSYMCSMMVGSIVFTLVPPSDDKAHYILKIVLTSASICFLSSILLKSEALVFWAFCLFELCVGAYFPSMASLKGKLIQDGSRGRIYGVLRLPLNLFVITAHSLAEEGDLHRNNVFLTCGGLLIVTFIVVQRYLTYES